ncbi:hypothetical protein LshimejAT787_1500890 [Lyophyllum shimeji]|uniref:Uncharacterized protein n=1 Tax=Lyophyllum shimeji TaxID=47721 RepID=A0A9P3PVV1_LYOSH|nr:hypothetical protein LshimejAT787_1500160 [Lyophyllum shimeji]GLB43905.1 hypothetical protein LshimejAT787_1500890 [Lyophyllum shimeji]
MTLEDLDKELEAMALIRALLDKYAHLSTSLMLLDKLDVEVVLGAFRSEDLHQKRAESADKPPGEWWKVKQPTPNSEDEGQEEEANIAGGVELTTWAEAMRSPDAEQWKQACLEEMKAHA